MVFLTKDYQEVFYNPYQIERYIYSLPLWRRIFARFFNKYKISKKEYDEWRYNNL